MVQEAFSCIPENVHACQKRLIPTKYWYIQSSILNSMMNAWAQPFKLGWLNIWVNLNHRIAAGDVVEPDMSSPVARATGCSKGLFWMGYYKVDAFCWKFDEPNAIFTCLKQSEKAEMASSAEYFLPE